MKRLFTRLITAFGAVILLTLVALSVALFALLRHDPLTQRLLTLHLSTQVRAVEGRLHRAGDPHPGTAAGAMLLRELARREDRRILWIDNGGIIRFDSAARWEGKSADTLLVRGGALHGGQHWGEYETDEGTWLFVAEPLVLHRRREGEIAVGMLIPRTALLRRFSATLLGPLLQAGALAMVLSGALALFISRSIAQPLQRVVEAAQALAAGDLSARAPEDHGPEEVRHLARTFNAMSDRIQATQEAQRAFLANVAHDLRTPLTSIQGFAQALIDGAAADEASRLQAAQTIYEEAQRLEKMTTALLDLARLEAGAMHLESVPLDLGALACARLERFRLQAEAQGIELRCERPPSLPPMAGDAARLSQVVDNLLDNALRYTPLGGEVTIEVTATGDELRLVVADTGEGIPAEALPHIFERFYRADPARGGSGVGLGLAIVREIVQAHGGSVAVESAPGQGSRFILRFPRLS